MSTLESSKTTPSLPDNSPSCADILAQAIEINPGIATATVNHRHGTLTLTYNANDISPHAADKIAGNHIDRGSFCCIWYYRFKILGLAFGVASSRTSFLHVLNFTEIGSFNYS